MSTERGMDEFQLHAWLDGELDAEDAAAVEAWLAEHPDDAARVAAWRAQNEALAGLRAELLDSPPPETLTRMLAAAPAAAPGSARMPRRGLSVWLQAAAALALFVAGGAAGWWTGAREVAGRKEPAQLVFVDQAVGAHVVFTGERRHAVEAWANKEERHLVNWLSKRLGRRLNPPSLDSAGFKLLGGRLVADHGGPAAQFMYENAAKSRLTLYVRSARDEKDVAFRIAESRGVGAFYWIERPYAYALIGKLDRQELLKLGRLVFDGLHKPGK